VINWTGIDWDLTKKILNFIPNVCYSLLVFLKNFVVRSYNFFSSVEEIKSKGKVGKIDLQ